MKITSKILLTVAFLTLTTIEDAKAFSRGKPFWEKKRSSSVNTIQQIPAQPMPPVSNTPAVSSGPPAVNPPVVVTPAPAPVPAPAPAPAPGSHYQEGDIIFIQSQSSQSAALREATGSVWTHVGLLVKQNSKWYVAEAVGPVVSTPLSDFIARSKNRSYEIYRFRHFDPLTMRAAMLSAIQKYNKPYDIYFEFSDARTYCSELTYKVMLAVTGQGLGRVQKMREMNLDGPYVKALVQKRLTEIGKELNLDEDIITPVSQMLDPDVTLVEKNN